MFRQARPGMTLPVHPVSRGPSTGPLPEWEPWEPIC
jgi:hypothetical protein